MPRKLITLSKPSKQIKPRESKEDATKILKKKKPVGFTGGINKLESRRNDIAVSDKSTIKQTRTISKISPNKKKNVQTVGGVRVKKSILQDTVLTPKEPKNKECADEESSELETIDSEEEDMVRFCKRMCKKTMDTMKNDKINEEATRLKNLKKFQKVRDKFIESIMKNFRKNINDNISKGNAILYQYTNKDMYEDFLIDELLSKPDNPETDSLTGLRIISDRINPFRLLHYVYRKDTRPLPGVPRESAELKEHRVLEVTWAIQSKKQLQITPNKLPEKYNKRWSIAMPGHVHENTSAVAIKSTNSTNIESTDFK